MSDLAITISKIIATLILFLIPLLPLIGLTIYSYILSKPILSLTKRYFNLNILFSRIWRITFFSGLSGLIHIFIKLFLYSSVNYILEITAVTIFITGLLAYGSLSNGSLRVATIMSFITTLAYLPFIIIVYNVINILLYLIPLHAYCVLETTYITFIMLIVLSILFNYYLFKD
ncbi:MAG: hypothetical protein ACO2ON_02520 [Candidatus Nanopusillus sp.]